MKHISIPVDQTCEFLEVTPINPLISKCQIKVMYVDDKPNRNGSVITKEVATQMAASLPGCPIVGFFNESKQDFEEHNKIIKVANGTIDITDGTIPYGFVDMHPRIWFQKFLDDNSVEREYLMTEGYIWTGQYPEAQRVITEGNNQSMELDEKTLDATWSKDENGKPQFFIINEAIISKLCILGEDVEPCFEGSQITRVQFSLDDEFQNKFYQMANELKQILNEGGTDSMFETYAVEIGDGLWCAMYDYLEKTFPLNSAEGTCYGSLYGIEGIFEEEGNKFAVLRQKETGKYYRMNFSLSESNGILADGNLVEVQKTFLPVEPQFALADVEAFEAQRYAKEEAPAEEIPEQEFSENEGKEGQENTDENEESVETEFSVEESEVFINLQNSFNELQASYDELKAQLESTNEELNTLREFKAQIDRKNKENMINSFYMLSDEEKKEVVENIDTYSLDEIEAKLSIICVRNKVNFNLDEEEHQDENKEVTTFNIHEEDTDNVSAPAWVRAVKQNMKKQ